MAESLPELVGVRMILLPLSPTEDCGVLIAGVGLVELF